MKENKINNLQELVGGRMSEQLQDRTIYVAPCGQKNP